MGVTGIMHWENEKHMHTFSWETLSEKTDCLVNPSIGRTVCMLKDVRV
jgi:hypothetical protein